MKKRWRVSLKVLGVLVTVLVVACAVHRAYWQAKFNRRVAELKAKGYPVSLDDLEAMYVLPEGVENAADVYIKAFEYYQYPSKSEKEYLPLRGYYEISGASQPLPPEVIDTLETSLNANQKTLELLDKAGPMEQCLFPREQDYNLLRNDHLVMIRNSARLLYERNLYLAHANRTDDLFKALPALLKYPNKLKMQACLIDEIVALGIKSLAVENIEHVINHIRFDEAQLQYLQKECFSMQAPVINYLSLINERCVMIESFTTPFNERPYNRLGSMKKLSLRFFYLTGFEFKGALHNIQFFQKYLDASDLSICERSEAFLMTDCESYEDFWWECYHWGSPGYHWLVDIDLRVIGQLRCAEVALAVERYRLKYGVLPGSLEDLAGEFMTAMPLDPFDGEVLRYVRGNEGYRIYTIGDDWEDNDGLSKDEMKEVTGEDDQEEYDWPFVVRR